LLVLKTIIRWNWWL